MRAMSMTNKVGKNSISQRIYFLLPLLLCLTFAIPSYAINAHPPWLQQSFDQVDILDKKDPKLALNFAQKLLAEKGDSMSDYDKTALYERLARYCTYLGEFTLGQEYIKQGFALKPDPASSIGISLKLSQASILDELGNSEQALNLYFEAEQLAKDSENSKMLADTYAYLANSYSLNHNDIEALKYFHQAYLLLEKLGDDLELAYLKAQMATSYSFINDDEKAISLATEVIQYFLANEYYFDALYAQSGLANDYLRMKDYQQAEIEFKKVIELSKKVGKSDSIYTAYIGLAKVYFHLEQNDKARYYYQLYESKRHQAPPPYTVIHDAIFIAQVELADENIDKVKQAISIAEQALTKFEQEKALSWYSSLYDLKSKLAKLENNYQAAYEYQSEYIRIKALYHNEERERVRSKYKVMFDTDQALLKNQLLERDKQLDKIALENAQNKQWLQNIIIIVAIIFVLILSAFIYRQVRTSKTLHKLANTDTLTELANRRFSFLYAEKMMSLAIREQEDFAIIIFDVDHFKQVNDKYGHAGGDIALKTLALTASEYVRNKDILGRIGGEEFLLVLPNTSAKQATVIAERIRLAIANKMLTINEQQTNITASFGVAELSATRASFNQLFYDADIALYQAKEKGRNQVVVAA